MFALKMRVVRVKKEKTEKINQVAHVDPKVEWARKVIVDYRGQKREECLVSYLKVLWEYTKYSGNKIVDHIRIRDGEFSGCKAQRVRKDSRDCPFVKGEATRTSSAIVKFDRAKEKLWYGDEGPVRAYTSSHRPVPLGTYDLEIPGFPHDEKGRGYGKHGITWFRVGYSGDRFLHTGEYTAGCVTVTWVDAWPKIYQYLITARKNIKAVGTIEIVEEPLTEADLQWLAAERFRRSPPRRTP